MAHDDGPDYGPDGEIEQRSSGMGGPSEEYYKGTNFKVPERKESSGFHYYDEPGVCAFCGSYKCNGSCFK